MDPRPTERERKQELIVALSRSRESLGATRREFRQVKKRLNPALRLRDAVRNHPLPIFGIAAGGALILTLVLRRPRAAKKPSSTKRLLLRWALSLAKPTARAWLLTKAKDHFFPLPEPPSAHTQ
jgi:hypothetical protein